MKTLRGTWLWACLCASAIAAAPAFARAAPATQAASAVSAVSAAPAVVESAAPAGVAKASLALRDPDFGVTTHQLGLERTVEMYQWNQAGQGYFAGWSLEPVDSSGFAAGHANPTTFPLPAREWRDTAATLDGKPLPVDVVARLAKWEGFRPGFSALPANMAATFQPDGDGLTSSVNPLDPQVGDLRVTWRALRMPADIAGQLVLRDGRWALAHAVAAGPVVIDGAATAAAGPVEPAAPARHPTWWWLGSGALVVAIAAFAAARRRRRARRSGDAARN